MVVINAILRSAIETADLSSRIRRRDAITFAILLLERVRTAELDDLYKWGNYNTQSSDELAAELNSAITILFGIYDLRCLSDKGIAHYLDDYDFWSNLNHLWGSDQ